MSNKLDSGSKGHFESQTSQKRRIVFPLLDGIKDDYPHLLMAARPRVAFSVLAWSAYQRLTVVWFISTYPSIVSGHLKRVSEALKVSSDVEVPHVSPSCVTLCVATRTLWPKKSMLQFLALYGHPQLKYIDAHPTVSVNPQFSEARNKNDRKARLHIMLGMNWRQLMNINYPLNIYGRTV